MALEPIQVGSVTLDPVLVLLGLLGFAALALLVLVVVFASIALGSFCGLLWPGLDPDRIGPSHASAYLAPYATVLLPNLVWLGGLFFCAGALTRRMLPVYIGSVVCIVGLRTTTWPCASTPCT